MDSISKIFLILALFLTFIQLFSFTKSRGNINTLHQKDINIINKELLKLEDIFNLKKKRVLIDLFIQVSPRFLQLKNDTDNETIICQMCKYTFNKINSYLREKYGLIWIEKLVEWLCNIGFTSQVCSGVIDFYESSVINSIIGHYLDAEYICSSKFLCLNSHYVYLDPDDYARRLLEDKPNKTKIQKYHEMNSRKGKANYTILHVTDIHTDLLYYEGSWGKCDNMICCRKSCGDSPNNEESAGRWGYVGYCDLPMITTYNFFENVKDVIKPDIILWTGDSSSHSIWNSTIQESINVVTFITTLIKNKFNISVPIYPSIGNHEFFPCDSFNPFNKSMNEVTFNFTSYLWRDWIGEEAYFKYREYGYYTIYNSNLNLRVISLNTMDCDVMNFNLILNPTDPAKQFEWIEKVLRQAEKNGEYVYIIGHIPPGDSTYLSQCSMRYNALIDRFSFFIKGQFFGHTHYDEFRIVHEYFNYNSIAGIIFTAPSLTTYSNKMPSFRLYEVDGSDNGLIDYHQFYLNITKANLNPDEKPIWNISYQASKEFNITNLSEYDKFFQISKNLKSDSILLNKILLKFFSDGPDYLRFKNYASKNYYSLGIGKYIGCRFEKDIFDEYLECTSYHTWDHVEYTNRLIETLSGLWYEKYKDMKG